MNQLVSASEADASLGFMARMMALCSLPRTNPGDRKEYKRGNGPYTLYMTAIGDNKLPYGNLPRLLLAWVSTEAVQTQSRELVLGRSLSDFMRALGLEPAGRPWAEESLLPSDPRARPRLVQDRVHPRLPEPAGASHADPTRAPQGRTATRPRPVRPLRPTGPTGSARLRTPNRRGELPASHPRSYHLLADSGRSIVF